MNMTSFRAIALWQPYATLVALGAKQHETRSWDTRYRGPLAIHAAARWTRYTERIAAQEEFRRALGGATLHRGAVLALVDLVETRPIGVDFWQRPENEAMKDFSIFGDYTPGRFVWVLRNVRPLREPFRCRGFQGFYNVEIPANLLP